VAHPGRHIATARRSANGGGRRGREHAGWTRLEKSVGVLVNLATLALALFAWVSIKQVNSEQNITEQGQITDRYNAAVENIGNASLDVRLGGIYALQRIMQDSPRDQPTVVSVLSAYIRTHAPQPKSLKVAPDIPLSDVDAALRVLGGRNVSHDGSTRVDLYDTYLSGANLDDMNLSDAVLSKSDLSGTQMTKMKLSHANLSGVNLNNANLSDTDLSGANLNGAYLVDADLSGANLSGADLVNANLGGADLRGANLSGAKRH
jgi:Pentapeptide repeats (8 copies)